MKYELSAILARVNEGRIELDGKMLRVGRFDLFARKGVKCVSCGIVGQYFKLDGSASNYHLNLYAVRNNVEVLMTRDHIVPVSRGGNRQFSNMQPMCLDCNNRKGNYVSTDKKIFLTIKAIRRLSLDVRKMFLTFKRIWGKTESTLEVYRGRTK